uniref:RAP domain-containing protein n=1 Tax=Knipowitschia caucasica TaxID=637954 RepID=A0AAV2JZY4_KNICA
MLRLQRVSLCLRSLFHSGTVKRDLILEQLRVCNIEDHVFDVVGKNRAKLNVDHVSMAVGMLWEFQKEKPQLLRNVDLIKTHPQFLTLRVLAENKIAQMDNSMLIDTLYSFLRLNVDQHDSLIQQMVSEAWLRLNKFSMVSLSKFSICLSDQYLQHSPLMGQITNILAQNLSTINDARILTTLMITSQEITDGLENTALLLADEFNAQQALAIAEGLEEIQSRNLSLMNKIAAVIQRNLHVYRPVEVARITQTLCLLQYQNPELYTKLRNILTKFLQNSVFPFEVTMLTRVLSLLPSPCVDESLITRIEAVVPQCNLGDLNTIANAVAKWVRNDASYSHNTPSKYIRLLQALNRAGHERLQTAERLDLLLEEINPSLMERIADVVIEDIDKIHYSATYATVLPFTVMNYDSVKVDEMYEACIRHFTPHISFFDPHLLVLLAYSLAVADCYPEEVIKDIFSIDFLGKLDSQLETLPDALNLRVRLRLMELNRAVCLECPEYQVPWFHERYCQRLQDKGNGSINLLHQQIYKMLGEILGGMNYVRLAVVTPYFYTIDFECILDKELKPLPYVESGPEPIPSRGQVQWGTGSTSIREELPPGAQRLAVDFLDSKSFCKNSRHMKGETLMRKRHLEILGYYVIQIPHFEWNSMELSTQDAWKDYLKKQIFRGCSLP